MDAKLNEESGVFIARREFDAATCERIIRLAGDGWERSQVDDSEGGEIEDKGLRESDIFWTKERWLTDMLFPYMESYNEVSGLKYEISGVETLQLTRYGVGGFYGFHVDGFNNHLWSVGGKIRKISMTIQLNEDYEGGEFEVIRCREGELEVETLDKDMGSMVLFPSCLEHRVKPVTDGVRYSLVAWFLGPPLR